MSAKDIFYNAAKAALQNDGWTGTEPLYLRWGDDQLRIHLTTERLIAAERAHDKIAVEVKSFIGTSAITDFHLALGQFLNYKAVLQIKQPQRQLYLAVITEIYRTFFVIYLNSVSKPIKSNY